jgi:RNA 3'-phosphate cyclase
LKNQHLSCIHALQKLARAKIDGAYPGSEAIEFFPGPLNPATVWLDIGTAGSIPLLLQSLLLPVMLGDGTVRLKIKGGTDTKWSIPIDYFVNLILPTFAELATVRIHQICRGFYPKGQGFLDVSITPRLKAHKSDDPDRLLDSVRSKAAPLNLALRSQLIDIQGVSAASQQLRGADVARRQAQGALKKIGGLCPLVIKEEYAKTASIGTVITLWANFLGTKGRLGADALGKRGVPSEKIGETAANKLLDFLNTAAAIDPHLADNIIPLLAIVGGGIRTSEITGHILSNMYVCEKFLNVRFTVDMQKNQITVK